MRTLLELALSNAAVALLPAALAIVVGLCCRRPALVHALWLLVLIKLLTPPFVRINLPWPAESPPVAAAPAEGVLVDDGAPPDLDAEEEGPVGDVIELPNEPETLVAAPAEDTTESNWARGCAEVLGWLWLLGSAGWFVLAVRRARSFSRALRHAAPAPDELVSRVAELARLVGLSCPPRTLLVPGRLTPMVWGVIRPVLLVPAALREQIGGEGMDTLIVHELAHLRRRDHWVRVLELLTQALWWWNPLVWYARQQLRAAEEQCCDAWVVRVMPTAARTYAVALVDALDFLSGPPAAAPALACGLGEVADLKRRLKMILGKTTPHGLGRAGGLAVVALGVLVLPLMTAVSRADEEEQQDQRGRGRGVLEQKLDDRDLEKLQAELKKRLDEVEQARKRLEEAKKRAQEEKAKARSKEEAKGETTLVIQISGLDGKEEIEKLTAALKKAMPGKEIKIVARVEGKGERRWEFERGSGMPWNWSREKSVPVPAPKAETPKVVLTPKVPQPPATPRATPDKRVDELEKKLDAILKELEAMKKEMKGGEPKEKGKGRGPGFGGGSGFGPKR